MKYILEEGLKAGAIGLSIGLLYSPGSYTTKEELAELCSVLPKYNGLLSTHIRGEGNHLLTSIEEVIWIAERSGAALHISHLKAAGKSNWGKIVQALELIEDGRARGLDITCDVYPYSAGSTTLTTLLPPWVLEGGIERTLERLSDPSIRQKIKVELQEEQKDWDNLVASTGWDSVHISAIYSEKNQDLEGKTIEDISKFRGTDPIDCFMDLLVEEEGQVSIVFFHMSNEDVNQVMRYDKALIASDSLHCQSAKPHPRLYGTFPRVLGKYVRDEGILTLEEAIRKITSFPAQRFQLGKRGLLVPSYTADIVIFDPEQISDLATYEHPKQFPIGISHTIVKGKETIKYGKHLHRKEGQVILRNRRCCSC